MQKLQVRDKPSTIFWVLIAWSIYGFFTNLDYTNQFGCIVIHEPVFSTPNILYSGIALLALSIGYFIPYRRIGNIVLIGELIFWIYKLMVVKGSYAVGFGGGASLTILVFDFVAVFLRLSLLKHLLSFKFSSLYMLIPAFVVIIIKSTYFPVPQSMLAEFSPDTEDIQIRKEEMTGDWVGLKKTTTFVWDSLNVSEPLENPYVTSIDSVRIHIEGSLMSIEGLEAFDNDLYIFVPKEPEYALLHAVLPDSLDDNLGTHPGLDPGLRIGPAITQMQLLYLTDNSMLLAFGFDYRIGLRRSHLVD